MTNGDDPELAALRQRRVDELQRQQVEQALRNQQLAEDQAQKSAAMRIILTPEARQRLNALRTTKPQYVESIEQQLIQLTNAGQIKIPITGEQLRKMLQQIAPKKKDITIERR